MSTKIKEIRVTKDSIEIVGRDVDFTILLDTPPPPKKKKRKGRK